MKVYSVEAMLRLGGASAGGNFSIFQKVWMEEHQSHEPESMTATCQHVFKEAIDKLLLGKSSSSEQLPISL